MSSKDKLDKRVRSLPKDLRFAEFQKFLTNHGFELRRSQKPGSHYVYTFKGRGIVTVTVPHGKRASQHVSVYQIKQALDILDNN